MKKHFFTFILFLLPLGAMAQTVDLEKDSLLVNLPYGNVLNVLASQVPGFSISPVDNAEGDMSATMTLRGDEYRSASVLRPAAASRTGAVGQQGILLGNDYQKMGTLAKLEYRPLDWVLVGVRASYRITSVKDRSTLFCIAAMGVAKGLTSSVVMKRYDSTLNGRNHSHCLPSLNPDN